MGIICTKPLEIQIGMWVEYTGAFRQGYRNPPTIPQNYIPASPNWICTTGAPVLSGATVSFNTVCNYPYVDRSNWTSPCIGCTLTDTAQTLYAAKGTFVPSVPGTCTVVWTVNIASSMNVGVTRFAACFVGAGVFGLAQAFLDTWVNGVSVEQLEHGVAANYVTPNPTYVGTQNVTRHVNAGDVVEYMFELFVSSGGGHAESASAVFSFAPDP